MTATDAVRKVRPTETLLLAAQPCGQPKQLDSNALV